MDGVSMQDAYFGGDILAAGTLNADFQVIPNKSGNYTGTLVVQYEDADGEQFTESVPLALDAAEADAVSTETLSTDTQTKHKSGVHWWIWLLILLLIVLAALLLWYFLVYKKKQNGDREEGEEEEIYDEETRNAARDEDL